MSVGDRTAWRVRSWGACGLLLSVSWLLPACGPEDPSPTPAPVKTVVSRPVPAELVGTPQGLAAGGDVDGLRARIDGGLAVDAPDGHDRSLLNVAATHGRADAVHYLLEKGARIDLVDDSGRGALHGVAYAIHWLRPEARRGMRLYAATGSDHRAVAEALLDRGADVHARDRYGYTPLHCAAQGGNLAVAALLIDRGADVNARTDGNLTPLHMAARGGDHDGIYRMPGEHAAVARLLLEHGADPTLEGTLGTPLSEATKHGAKDVAEVLLGAQTSRQLASIGGLPPLLAAAHEGDVDLVEKLLARGVPVDSRDAHGRTALFMACLRGRDATVALLLRRGAKVDATTRTRRTPAHAAADSGSVATLTLLLAKGADPLVRDERGNSLLHAAAGGCEAGEAMLEALLAHGLDMNGPNADGKTPLRLTEESDCLIGGSPMEGPLRKRGARR